ncbi:cyclopropane-fatty-acyl-phospholipid synthase [Lojkania enalia]|uniref:Cyclopropane-fatty-acyl-phospholipid synthase n=1 Tax=Lojkania enalia TaxID=147567 RepID=A0A9P4N5A1_9PLEO|nr:cyclopropane-fatty-acyl-phospholipid synthase [Didymosphaeria enalia]
MALIKLFEPQLTRFARNSVLATLSKIQNGEIIIVIKDGLEDTTFTFGSTKADADILSTTVTILDRSVWTRLISNLDVGVAESYMLQHLECSDLLNLFMIYIQNWETFGSGNPFFQIIPRFFRLLRPTNDPAHALKNASFHYDTSNDLFTGFLSPDLNYSCALWSPEPGESLETAQMRKVRNIINLARISSTDHILDIGGGWGSLAIEAVRMTGCRVTAISLSKEQKTLFDKRVQEVGYSDRIEMIICDYRKTPRPESGYDRIVSVEMLEHVGREHMDEYFSTISHLLKPEGGVMVIQGITMINKFSNFRTKVDNFIDRYIFPGGYLPPINSLLSSIQTGSKGALEIESVQSIGPHYIRTLRLWAEKFEQNWPNIKEKYIEAKKQEGQMLKETELEAFRRRWEYYFKYCEVGFRAGVLGDHVVSAVRRPMPEFPNDVPL